MKYNIHKPWLSLDDWQKEYIETEGNCFLLCGRQSGKSTAMAIKFGRLAAKKPQRSILMIAFTENQAYLLFFKTLMYLEANYAYMIKRGSDKPTKHKIQLRNGSIIMCYAAGIYGAGLVGHTVTNLVIDEAASMAREVFTATTPMLSVTNGVMDLSSTPKGKEGYFYECSDDPALGDKIRKDFTRFYVSAEDCPRHPKKFLEQEKATMSSLRYAQEYLARFLDELMRVFSDEWIDKVCKIRKKETITPTNDYSMGCDIARLGDDEGSFEILDHTDYNNIKQVDSIVTKKKRTTETEDRIYELNEIYKFKKIYIDAGSGSLGVGIFDHLLRDSRTKRKVVAINNRTRPLERDGSKSARLLKEDLYDNLVNLGEREQILLLNDEKVKASLRSIQFEFKTIAGAPSKVRIWGNYSHIAEGLIRAAWIVKDKTLKIWVR